MHAKIGIIAFCTIAAIVLVFVSMSFSFTNQEVELRTRAEAQQKAVEVVFDETWKVIAQQAQVADKYRESFKEIYPALMEGRYGNARGGALMSWVTESNPDFDTSLFDRLSRSIEAKRAALTREQKVLLDVKRSHDALRQRLPSRWFVGDVAELEAVVITSTRAETAAATGKDDDVGLF